MKHDTPLRLVVGFMVSLLVACQTAVRPASSENPPPPVFTRFMTNALGGAMGVYAEPIWDYIALYGRSGWLKGLGDARPLDMVMAGGPHMTDTSGELRVKDVFLAYYKDGGRIERGAWGGLRQDGADARDKKEAALIERLSKMP